MKHTLSFSVVFSFVVLFASSCMKTDGNGAAITVTSKKDSISPLLIIGQHYQGGVLFYLDSTGKHGLIAAPTDQSQGLKWCNNCDLDSVRTTATDNLIGSGLSNTTKIVDKFRSGDYAAKICYDLVLNGYDDWFLPSGAELQEMWKQKDKIGGFASDWYWSSTDMGGEPQAVYARNILFPTGTVKLNANMLKGTPNHVRAIRMF